MQSSQDGSQDQGRSRLVLIAPADDQIGGVLDAALSGGDVASVILARNGLGDTDYLANCRALVGVVQARDVAALVVDDSVALGRTGADGIVFEQPGNDFRELVEKYSPQNIVGFAGNFTRHRAMELGEGKPDFLMFGRIGGDIRPEPHPKNLAMAHWWSQMVEIPCVVLAGSSVESVSESAATGSEFVAIGRAAFEPRDRAGESVETANRLLDEEAALQDGI